MLRVFIEIGSFRIDWQLCSSSKQGVSRKVEKCSKANKTQTEIDEDDETWTTLKVNNAKLIDLKIIQRRWIRRLGCLLSKTYFFDCFPFEFVRSLFFWPCSDHNGTILSVLSASVLETCVKRFVFQSVIVPVLALRQSHSYGGDGNSSEKRFIPADTKFDLIMNLIAMEVGLRGAAWVQFNNSSEESFEEVQTNCRIVVSFVNTKCAGFCLLCQSLFLCIRQERKSTKKWIEYLTETKATLKGEKKSEMRITQFDKVNWFEQ